SVADGDLDRAEGTAVGRVELRGDMHSLLAQLRQGEAVAATGLVELVDGVAVVVVDSSDTLVRVGALGQGVPIGESSYPGPGDSRSAAAPRPPDSGGGMGGPGPLSPFALAGLAH